MALVFKIKYQETLRRWVLSESQSVDVDMLSLTHGQLENKIRELFELPASASLVITYMDKDGDVITLADDGDLVDACLVQRLNPLRLDVQVLGLKPEASAHAPPEGSSTSMENFNMETFIKALFPQATTDAVQGFLGAYAPFLDPKLPLATLILKVQDTFKEFVERVSSDLHRPGSSDRATRHHHHPYKHPHTNLCSKNVPHESGPHKEASAHPVYHMGIQCDGCGMIPIRGTRYKSTKILDYDLCSSCFQEKGEEIDFEKLEQPHHSHYHGSQSRRWPRPFMGPPMSGRSAFAHCPFGWRPERGAGGHPMNFCFPCEEHKKLDSRFVKDVTVFDGTELVPGTKFTKIWRMSNIGSLPWPQSTQLIRIGGDVLGSQEAVTLELPESGLASGEDVEISVDLVAPEKAGRYVSHWCLIAPSGQKFGQSVMVMIQVVPQGEQSPLMQESLKDGAATKDTIDERNMPLAGHPTPPSMEMNDPDLTGKSSHDAAFVSEDIVYPMIDMSEEIEGFSLVEKPVTDEVMKEKNTKEEAMVEITDNMSTENSSLEANLQALESMGFANRELMAFLLNKNKGNLQATMDELLVATGWDAGLRDLLEMGFTDQDTNTRLLFKHKGSIKAVVKDLVKMEKQKVEA